MAKKNQEKLGDQLVSVNRVHLDTDNPRHGLLESDAQIIAELCGTEKVANLAGDIAVMGLSPLEQLGVIPVDGNPGHFISVEGNRRTCALLLLHDPNRAPTPELKAQFKKAAAGKQLPKDIRVHVFADREAAKPWIDRRHLGEQDGVGTKPWDPTQQQRAAGGNRRTSANANALSVAVLDRLVERGHLTDDQRAEVSLTTLTRYLGTPGVRTVLGLGSARELVYTHDEDQVEGALTQLVKDSVAERDGVQLVNSRANSTERQNYANRLKAEGVAPTTVLQAPAQPTPIEQLSARASAATASAKKRRSSPDPAKQRTLFTASLTVKSSDPVLMRLRRETVELLLEDHPFSGIYLLRAFVERTFILFLKKRGRYSPPMTDLALSQACAAELKAMGVKGSALSTMDKAAGNADQPHSLHSLGHAVHGGTIPSRDHIRAMADTWLPTLKVMLDAL